MRAFTQACETLKVKIVYNYDITRKRFKTLNEELRVNGVDTVRSGREDW